MERIRKHSWLPPRNWLLGTGPQTHPLGHTYHPKPIYTYTCHSQIINTASPQQTTHTQSSTLEKVGPVIQLSQPIAGHLNPGTYLLGVRGAQAWPEI